jgi:hypothetical protein
MDRFVTRCARRAAAAAMSFFLVSMLTGCIQQWAMVMLVLNGGNDVDAEYTAHDGLGGKRVAVVCRRTDASGWQQGDASSELAKRVGMLLKKNIRHIKIVDPGKVAEWTDEQSLETYAEIGEALKADVVIGIDLAGYQVKDRRNRGLLQGKAMITLKVYDLVDGDGEVTWEKQLPESTYPATTPISDLDKPERTFRQEFTTVLAGQISRHFYDHNSTDHFAQGGGISQ